MKQHLMSVLLSLMLASGLIVGCGQSQKHSTNVVEDKASWTEKQVIDYLYDYLIEKTEQEPNLCGEANIIIMTWKFRDAILGANNEALEEDTPDRLGNLIEPESSIESIWSRVFNGALRRLAHYDGDGWWSILIAGEWRLSERTEEVVAWNEEALELLEDITHCTYRSSMYGYHIDYPAVWTLTQIGNEGKVLIVAPESQVDILVDKHRRLEAGQSLGECASGFATFLSMVYQNFELTSLIKLENGDYQMNYEWVLGGNKICSRTHFMLHNGWVYMISGSAPKSTYESYLAEFDYAYNSFGFD